MSSKSKTRFSVLYNGVPRELFSVRQRNDDSLVILLKTEINHEDSASGENRPIEAERISVHLSPRSPGTTITRTTTLVDKTITTSAQFVKNSKTNLLSLVFTKSCSEPNDRDVLKSHNRDTVISVGSYGDTDMATLIYSVIVANKGRDLPVFKEFALYKVELKRFLVGVYLTYLNFPHWNLSTVAFPATSPEKTDGTTLGELLSEGVGVLSDELFQSFLMNVHWQISLQLKRRMIEAMPDFHPELSEWPLWLHADTIDLALGRRERQSV